MLSIQVLHSLLRRFGPFMTIVLHRKAKVLKWNETVSINPTIKKVKRNLQEKILKKSGEKWDFPDHSGKGGTTTTGNTARRLFLNEEMRNFVVAGDGICETHKFMEAYGIRTATCCYT